MAKVQLTSQKIVGAAGYVTIAVEDDSRKYLGIYSNSESVYIDVGDHTGGTAPMTMGVSGYFEPAGMVTSKVQYAGDSTDIVVLQDVDSKIVICSDGIPLTYDSTSLYYQNRLAKHNGQRRPAAPVFS